MSQSQCTYNSTIKHFCTESVLNLGPVTPGPKACLDDCVESLVWSPGWVGRRVHLLAVLPGLEKEA